MTVGAYMVSLMYKGTTAMDRAAKYNMGTMKVRIERPIGPVVARGMEGKCF